jgi:hypothetical protein
MGPLPNPRTERDQRANGSSRGDPFGEELHDLFENDPMAGCTPEERADFEAEMALDPDALEGEDDDNRSAGEDGDED